MVMTQLRSQMKLILWILVFAFLATIVFSWGMGGFKSSEKPGVVAEINDHEITYEGFDNLMRFTYENAMRQSGGQLEENQAQRLREDTWDQEVERLLKAEDVKRLGLKTTDRQIAYIVENFPPNEIQQVEAFQRDGKFDIELYRSFLRDPQALGYLLDFERRVEGYLLNQELNFHVTNGIDVSIDEVRDEYFREMKIGTQDPCKLRSNKSKDATSNDHGRYPSSILTMNSTKPLKQVAHSSHAGYHEEEDIQQNCKGIGCKCPFWRC